MPFDRADRAFIASTAVIAAEVAAAVLFVAGTLGLAVRLFGLAAG